MAFQFFYDRVKILVDGLQYLPNGQVRSFRISAPVKSSINHGFSPTGQGVGIIQGGYDIDFSWNEYLPTQDDYVNWRTFLIANPNSIITIIPFSLATGVTPAPQFTITGIVCTNQGADFTGESSPGTRDLTFKAITSSNI